MAVETFDHPRYHAHNAPESACPKCAPTMHMPPIGMSEMLREEAHVAPRVLRLEIQPRVAAPMLWLRPAVPLVATSVNRALPLGCRYLASARAAMTPDSVARFLLALAAHLLLQPPGVVDLARCSLQVWLPYRLTPRSPPAVSGLVLLALGSSYAFCSVLDLNRMGTLGRGLAPWLGQQ